MTSKIAEQTYNKWIAEGLSPTFNDIVELNCAGMQLERNSNSAQFFNCPRVAFLGDYVFHELTIRKRIYLDKLLSILDRTDKTTLIYAMCYVMYMDCDELVELKNTKDIIKVISSFANTILSDFTYGQVLYVVEYLMTCSDEYTLDGCYSNDDQDVVTEAPQQVKSYASWLLKKAVSIGLDAKGCDDMTENQLENILLLAAIHNGADVMKDRNIEYTAKFYQVSGKIYRRLKEEKNNSVKSI